MQTQKQTPLKGEHDQLCLTRVQIISSKMYHFQTYINLTSLRSHDWALLWSWDPLRSRDVQRFWVKIQARRLKKQEIDWRYKYNIFYLKIEKRKKGKYSLPLQQALLEVDPSLAAEGKDIISMKNVYSAVTERLSSVILLCVLSKKDARF